MEATPKKPMTLREEVEDWRRRLECESSDLRTIQSTLSRRAHVLGTSLQVASLALTAFLFVGVFADLPLWAHAAIATMGLVVTIGSFVLGSVRDHALKCLEGVTLYGVLTRETTGMLLSGAQIRADDALALNRRIETLTREYRALTAKRYPSRVELYLGSMSEAPS